MQPATGSKRSREQADEKEKEAAMTFNATRHDDGERAAQRLRMEGQRRAAAAPAAALGPTVHHQSDAAAAAASPSRTHHAHAFQTSTHAGRITDVTQSRAAAAAVSQQAGARQSKSLGEQPTQASSPQAATAAARRPLTSPAQRCDLDSLSLVFALLNTGDFLAAIRVCRQWRSARMKHTAWPQLHLPTLIQSLRDDDYGNPDRRRLNVAIRPRDPSRLTALLGPSTTVTAANGPTSVSAVSMWRHATDVELRSQFPRSAKMISQEECELALQRVGHLPHLSALNLHGWTAGDDAVALFYSAVSTRLQALLLFDCASAFLSHLPFLANLRVLVLDRMPAANDLIPLQRLEYLRFDSHLKRPEWHLMGLFMIVQPPSAVATALRWLSSDHSLRSLSVKAEYFDFGYWEPLFRPARTAEEDAQLAEFGAEQASDKPVVVDWTKPCGLTDVSMMGELSTTLVSSICALPQLTRLQCPSRHLWQGDPPPVSTLAILQRLSLFWRAPEGVRSATQLHSFPDWQQLSRLRVLELTSASAHVSGRVAMSAADLQRLLATCTTTLEELRLGPSIRINHGEAGESAASTGSFASSSFTAVAAQRIQVPNGWSVLAQCTRLRVLEMPLQPSTADSGMLEALALLPAFQSLELILCEYGWREWPAPGARLPPKLLQHISRSRSWCSLHIRAVPGMRADDLLSAGGLVTQMPVDQADESAAKRLRVHIHHDTAKVLSYAIRTDQQGVTWRRA